MENNGVCKLFLACVLGLVAILPSSAPSSAQSQSEATDNLMQDIGAYSNKCMIDVNDVNKFMQSADHTTLQQQCANEKNGLVAAEQKLGLSADALNNLLTSRGFRGFRGFR
jgi:hypothetical protein